MLSVAAELGLAIELQLQHEINPDNVGELIAFLQRPDVKVTELWLNLSSKIPELPLRDLLSAVDALLGLAKLRIEVDGQSKESSNSYTPGVVCTLGIGEFQGMHDLVRGCAFADPDRSRYPRRFCRAN